jgi:FG-GAP-like repeat
MFTRIVSKTISLFSFLAAVPLALSTAQSAECQWLFSSGGNADFQEFAKGPPISEIRLGDFDGDGKTDVFFTAALEGSAEHQWKFSPGGIGEIKNLRVGPPISKLGFGDFDGDGKTDVFTIRDESLGRSQMLFSSGGSGGFEKLANVSSELADEIRFLRFGDFDGDRITDVFTWKRGDAPVQYIFSSGARGDFQNLAKGLVPLGFGDFNGDKRTDVFVIGQNLGDNLSQWMFSSGGSGNFQNLTVGRPTKPEFGDFDADGKTDVFLTEPLSDGRHQWVFSSGGLGEAQLLGIDGPLFDASGVKQLGFGDFDGDGKTDGLAADCR